MYAIAPNGKHIVASCDFVPGNALINTGSFRREPDGSIDFDWVGDTEMCWDGQYTLRRGGQDVFVDDAGEEWTLAECTFIDGEEAADQAIAGYAAYAAATQPADRFAKWFARQPPASDADQARVDPTPASADSATTGA